MANIGLQLSSSNSKFRRLITRAADIHPRELSAVLAAFCLFFFMWAGYFAVRPVRETIGTILGRQQVADLWIVTALISILIIPIYGTIVARVRRSVFLPGIYAAVAVVLAVIGFAMRQGEVTPLIGKTFYVFISVVNLFLISMFWSFLLELFDADQSKRLFGFIAAGGSAGALAGPLISDLAVSKIGNSGILYLSAGLFLLAIVCQQILHTVTQASGLVRARAASQEDRPIGGNIFAGVTEILRSPYILGIALFVVFISTVNTFLYFEQLHLVEIAYPDTTDRTRVFARLDWIVQTLTVLSQLFLTGRIARRFGVRALLTWVPVAMVIGFLGIAAVGTFAILAVVFVLRRACEYAFIRPGREMLWSPLDRETKYKAKSTVDVPIYRGADAIAAQVSNGLASLGIGITGVALLGACVAAAWAALGWFLGREYQIATSLRAPSTTAERQREVA
jgi:ATP:ADP antiporter, AAA family